MQATKLRASASTLTELLTELPTGVTLDLSTLRNDRATLAPVGWSQP